MPTLATIELPPPSDWNEFEDICADLFALTWDDQNTIRYGRQGQRQNGVDIRGRVVGGPLAGVQCKGKRQWPPKKLTTREIDKQVTAALQFTPPLSQFTIVTTAEDDAPLQSHADAITECHRERGLFSVHVLGWSELSRRIKSHGQLIEKYYSFTTLSSVRSDIAETPERTLRLVADHFRGIGVTAALTGGIDASIRSFDAIRSGLADALDRDFESRYRRAMQRAPFPECLKVDELHKLAQEIEEGDYAALSQGLRRKILLRAARSTSLRDKLQESERLFATAILFAGPEPQLPAAARIAEARGDVDGAIRILRDQIDNDSRSVLLSVLARRRGDESALTWFSDERLSVPHLTANGVLTLCQIYLRQQNFRAARETLTNLGVQQLVDYPYFLYFRGVVRVATLFPKPEQGMALSGLPLNVGFAHPIVPEHILTAELDAARSDLERFLLAAQGLDLREALRVSEAYLVWSDLLHPGRRDAALAQLRTDMNEPAKALSRIQFAFAYVSQFDALPLTQYLDRRETLGGLDNDELRAALVIRLHSNKASPIAQLIAKYRPQFEANFTNVPILAIEIHALAMSNDSASAKALLEANKELLGEDAVARLGAEIARAEGADPVVEYRHAYEATRTPDTLRALVGALLQKQDYRVTGPYAEKLYELTADPGDMAAAAKAYANSGDRDNFLRVVDACPIVKEHDPGIAGHYAWQMFDRGCLKEAKEAADELRSRSPGARDLNLEIAIGLETGEWEMLVTPLAALLENAVAFDGPTLIRAAGLAQALGQGPLTDLMNAAVAKGGDDPGVLIGAYTLVIGEGLEELMPEAHQWFSRALDLSGPEGPIRQFQLKDLLAQHVQWMEDVRFVNEAIVRGEIPLLIAAPGLRTTLGDVILGNFERNGAVTDTRQRAVIATFSGRRMPSRIGSVKRLALDLTTLMVLGWLKLLPKVLETFPEIVVPAGALFELFEGRRRIRLFQRSRLTRAAQIQSFIARNRLKVLRLVPATRDPLAGEIGAELTALIRAAESADGIVIRPAPVHRLGFEEQRDADMSGCAAHLADMHALLQSLTDLCVIDQNAEETARRYFAVQDRRWPSAPHLEAKRPLYLDSLALVYLQTVDLLDAVLSTFKDVYVCATVEEDAAALIEYDRHITEVLRTIDDIRKAVRKANAAGKIIFGPRNAKRDHERLGLDASTLHLVSDLVSADAVAFDDRALNKEPFVQDNRGHRAPTVTSLDIIEELLARDLISPSDRRFYRHRLRIAGAALVPADADEIKLAAMRNRQNESPEFRAMRDSLDLARLAEIPRFPGEMPWFIAANGAPKTALMQIWKDEDDAVRAASIASAILEILPRPEDWVAQWEGQPPPEWIAAVRRVNAASLALPFELSGNQHAVEAYNDWLERTVLAPMRATEPENYAALVAHVKSFILDSWNRNDDEPET